MSGPSGSATGPTAVPAAGAHVVVGHDGHAAAQAALAVAADLARRIGAHLHVVHSVTIADYGVDPDTEAFEQACEHNLAAERAGIASALAGIAVAWTYHEETGDPAVCLARVADELDAQFIVVGTTRRSLLHAAGSVPKRLLHGQTRPVVVVPDARSHRHRRDRAAAGGQ